MRTLVSLVLSGLLSSAALAEPRSIVGHWRWPDQPCSPVAGAIQILPMGLKSEDLLCKFKSVKREGDTVTWQGPCDSAEGGAQYTVTAREVAGRLTIRFRPGGNVLEGLVRCDKAN